jgi:predicted transcriptional regulator
LPHQLTIRYDDTLAREIEELARREGISRNQAAVRLLRKGARLEEPDLARDAVGQSLDWFIGSWTREQARELEEAIADFEMVEDLWR